MTPNEFKTWRQRLGFTQVEAAAELKLTAMSISNYESGRRGISDQIASHCDAIERRRKRGRAHHTAERRAAGDKCFTPAWAAQDIVTHFAPQGVVLEPCRGRGAIHDLLPAGSPWCEIDDGRDFFTFTEPVDWIVSNPPYDQTRAFMRHAFTLADNVVFLVPARNVVSGYGTVQESAGFGGLVEVRWYGSGNRLGFPMGNAIAAFHWRRGHNGETRMSYHDESSLKSPPPGRR
jgi:hypothetical protein